MKQPKKEIGSRHVLLRVISFFLLLSFFVASVVAIIIAQGNIIDFSNGEIVTTGTLRIESNVEDFTVFIEDKQTGISNNRIENLKPGEYKVKLEKEGYSSWENIVKIRAGIISAINVQLFPSQISIQRFIDSEILYAVYSQDGKYVFYVVEDPISSQNSGLWRLSLQSSSVISIIDDSKVKILSLTPALKTLTDSGSLKIQPSSDNERLLIGSADNTNLFTVSANRFNDTNNIKPLTFPYPVDLLSWFKDSNNLIVRTGNNLLNYKIDSNSYTLINIFSEEVSVYSISNDLDEVYFARNNSLFKYVDRSEEEVLFDELKVFTDSENIIDILYSKDNIIITKNSNGLYYIDTELEIKQSLGDYNLVSVSPDSKNLLLENATLYTSLEVEKIANNKTVSLNYLRSDISTDLNTESINWAQDSSFFTFKLKASEGLLYAASRRANNIVELVNLELTKIEDKALTGRGSREILITINIPSDTGKDDKFIYQLDI